MKQLIINKCAPKPPNGSAAGQLEGSFLSLCVLFSLTQHIYHSHSWRPCHVRKRSCPRAGGWGTMGTEHVLILTWVSLLCDLVLQKQHLRLEERSILEGNWDALPGAGVAASAHRSAQPDGSHRVLPSLLLAPHTGTIWLAMAFLGLPLLEPTLTSAFFWEGKLSGKTHFGETFYINENRAA